MSVEQQGRAEIALAELARDDSAREVLRTAGQSRGVAMLLRCLPVLFVGIAVLIDHREPYLVFGSLMLWLIIELAVRVVGLQRQVDALIRLQKLL
ncbi:hypothetical protein [Mitsuaria sp. 7]|uniref:hypothetical protein n=1 Tax=Mitsuaria sp. 7 TaxID=1658665 RepID=UPI0007DDA3D5|nr:hypothetical protein [Mitsuaria sp. 7]ANH69933.1 hypothetical protein ABE85_24315 [Mitsuaria sp. 7]